MAADRIQGAMITSEFVARLRRAPRLPLVPFGAALSLFLAITYVLCVGYDLVFPAYEMHRYWDHLLPGFTWLSWGSSLIGLIDSLAYGWYVALIFVPLFNYFSVRFER
ncbi:MAG: DUF5676 family membrane protein [Rhodospirillales bacterium]|nr:DUF5676 family membrane protein [Rhodospirillales bacterium]